jgi:hypothetical protein
MIKRLENSHHIMFNSHTHTHTHTHIYMETHTNMTIWLRQDIDINIIAIDVNHLAEIVQLTFLFSSNI